MIAFEETDPLPASLNLDKVIMRFLKDSAIPAIDDWGSCVGIVHRDDCKKVCIPILVSEPTVTHHHGNLGSRIIFCVMYL